MRDLRLVVNDIARSMRRQGNRLAQCDDASALLAGRALINYAELLREATKRKTKVRKKT